MNSHVFPCPNDRLQGPAMPRPRAQRQHHQFRFRAAEQRQTQRRGGLLPGAETLEAEVVGKASRDHMGLSGYIMEGLSHILWKINNV